VDEAARRLQADRFVGVAFAEQLFDAIDATAVTRKVAADLDVQLLQFQLVLVEHSMPQLGLLLLTATAKTQPNYRNNDNNNSDLLNCVFAQKYCPSSAPVPNKS